MSDPNATVTVLHGTIREHLAGIHAARVWIQDLAAQHLLSYQDLIRDRPIPGEDQQP